MTAKRCLNSTRVAPAVGPYSHAVAAGGLLFVSGQLGMDPASRALCSPGVTEQARQALDNLRTVLEDCGSGLDNVVKTTVFLADIGDFAAFNEVYALYFGQSSPARSCVEVGGLPLGAKVEIEAIALCSG